MTVPFQDFKDRFRNFFPDRRGIIDITFKQDGSVAITLDWREFAKHRIPYVLVSNWNSTYGDGVFTAMCKGYVIGTIQTACRNISEELGWDATFDYLLVEASDLQL